MTQRIRDDVLYVDGVPVDMVAYNNGAPSRMNIVRADVDVSGNVTGLVGPDGTEFLVISSSAPNNADGRADGTIYIQTA